MALPVSVQKVLTWAAWKDSPTAYRWTLDWAVWKSSTGIPTHHVDEGRRALGSHGLSLTTGLPRLAPWMQPLAPNTIILGCGCLAATAVTMSHGTVI